ncbi:MAG: GNAT family N-acetyltransferase [Planktotalea sp.]|uniref:GNAT family N-acetyltransferase n=1 Tax=Planktotalea sp. TaxID=2029877 RepID=UPI003C78ABC6
MIIVEPTTPHAAGTKDLLEQSHALMLSLFSPDACHFLDFDALAAENIHLFAAREGDVTLGTGALAVKDGYAEVKSMFTSEAARGKGVAAALLRQIEDVAREMGLQTLKLETGDVLYAAHRLYERHGFTFCGPFGDYKDVPESRFMEKVLTVETA